MHGVRVETAVAQASCQLVRDHHGTMTAAGAADADRQIRLTLALVLRQQVVKEFAKTAPSPLHLRVRLKISNDAPITSRQVPQLVYKKRIRQMPHVEKQFHVFWRPKLVAETKDLHAQRRRLVRRPE